MGIYQVKTYNHARTQTYTNTYIHSLNTKSRSGEKKKWMIKVCFYDNEPSGSDAAAVAASVQRLQMTKNNMSEWPKN